MTRRFLTWLAFRLFRLAGWERVEVVRFCPEGMMEVQRYWVSAGDCPAVGCVCERCRLMREAGRG